MLVRPSFLPIVALSLVLFLGACAETQFVSHLVKTATWSDQNTGEGKYKVGKPYKVGSVWYYPEENFSMVETGIASWYGPGFHAKYTANGERYDQRELTAAHRTLQMPSLVRVTNLENGRSVVVRVNDRGPFKHGRVIDVSERAAELLGFVNKGTARVRLQVLEKESQLLAAAAKRGEDTTRVTVAELQSPQKQKVISAPPVQKLKPPAGVNLAALERKGTTEDLPESLLTPTITVEELNAPAPSALTPPPSKVAGHMNEGRFMPDPVVATAPIRPTGIYVQAGSFAVYENAARLTKRLSPIAEANIEPIMVKGRKLYRVKLGPVASVEEADRVLNRVIDAGEKTARVVKTN